MNAAIAQHLNVTESAIIEVQEWARVLWVRVKGIGARFVSKKVTKAMIKQVHEVQIGEVLRSRRPDGTHQDRKVAEILRPHEGTGVRYEDGSKSYWLGCFDEVLVVEG